MEAEPYWLTIEKSYQLWKVANPKATQPYARYVLLSHDSFQAPVAIVADGHVLAAVPAEWLEDRRPPRDVLIAPACIRAAKGHPIAIDLERHTARVGDCQWDLGDVEWPNWRRLIPETVHRGEREQRYLVPDQALRLQLALGGSGWKAVASDDGPGPVIVVTEDALGLIVPPTRTTDGFEGLEPRLQNLAHATQLSLWP